jgi:predicted transcriptional regulator of viral defense system
LAQCCPTPYNTYKIAIFFIGIVAMKKSKDIMGQSEHTIKAVIQRTRDLEEQGLSRNQVRLLAGRGELVEYGRGLYAPSHVPISAQHTLVEVALRVPRAIICLTSALRFHELTTQDPWQIHILLPIGAWTPKLEAIELAVFRTGEPTSWTEGIEVHEIEGVSVSITTIARTVADCFKWRRRVGLDIALEALKESVIGKRTTIAEINYFARQNRVEKVMRPYIEAIVA